MYDVQISQTQVCPSFGWSLYVEPKTWSPLLKIQAPLLSVLILLSEDGYVSIAVLKKTNKQTKNALTCIMLANAFKTSVNFNPCKNKKLTQIKKNYG